MNGHGVMPGEAGRRAARAGNEPPYPVDAIAEVAISSRLTRVLEDVYQRPHTATLLVSVVSVFIYAAFGGTHRAASQEDAVALGVWMACIPLLVYGCLQFQDGLYRRPFPVFWRLVMGVSLLYLMFLVFLLMQTRTTAISVLAYLDPLYTGTNFVDSVTHADDCSLTWTNVGAKIDVFVISHAAGWFVKAMMIRDRALLLVASVVFELLELTFRNMLLNFRECWWDSWVLDVLLCNWIGIEAGLWFCRYLGASRFHWTYVSNKQPPLSVRMTAAFFSLFTPQKFDSFRWHVFESRFQFLASSALLFFLMMADLNAFFLKAVLDVRVESKLNFFRLVINACAAFPAVREMYQYVSDPSCHRFGSQAWILSAIILTEICIILKFGPDIFPHRFLDYFTPTVKFSWLSACILWCAFVLFFPFRPKRLVTAKRANTVAKKKK